MSFWRLTLLALVALALGAILSGCAVATYPQPIANDPKDIPWDHSRVSDPPNVGDPMFYGPPSNGLQYNDGPGNGLR